MTKYPPRCVFPEWMFNLPMQQQSVLLLASRGPDGIEKHHPCKIVHRAYRGTVFKAAKMGRILRWGESADTFMSLDVLADAPAWADAVNEYFDTIDSLPHHYHMHLMHGAQILGYKHPDMGRRLRWQYFYQVAVADAHLMVESEEQMDLRLNDWNQKGWGEHG